MLEGAAGRAVKDGNIDFQVAGGIERGNNRTGTGVHVFHGDQLSPGFYRQDNRAFLRDPYRSIPPFFKRGADRINLSFEASCRSVPGQGYLPTQTTWVGRTLSIARAIWSMEKPSQTAPSPSTCPMTSVRSPARAQCRAYRAAHRVVVYIRAAVGIVNNDKVFFMT